MYSSLNPQQYMIANSFASDLRLDCVCSDKVISLATSLSRFSLDLHELHLRASHIDIN